MYRSSSNHVADPHQSFSASSQIRQKRAQKHIDEQVAVAIATEHGSEDEQVARAYQESLQSHKQGDQTKYDSTEQEQLARAFSENLQIHQRKVEKQLEEDEELARAYGESIQSYHQEDHTVHNTMTSIAQAANLTPEEEQISRAIGESLLSCQRDQELREDQNKSENLENLACALNESLLTYHQEVQTQEEQIINLSLAEATSLTNNGKSSSFYNSYR